jgi:hypothetical protein
MAWWRFFRGRRSDDGIHRDSHGDGYDVNVHLTFRDASIEERHDDRDREEFKTRQSMLEARVAALEMGSRDDA